MTDDDKKLLRILSEAPLSDWVYHEEIKRDYFLHKSSGVIVCWSPSDNPPYRTTTGKHLDNPPVSLFSYGNSVELFRSLLTRRDESLREAKEKLRQETVSAALEMLED